MEEGQERAVATLSAETSLPGLLHAATREFLEIVDGDASAISRVVGDVLIQVAERARDDRTLVLGHGYLISDFPLTEAALRHDEPHCVSLLDPDPDPREASLLRELKLDSLLMLPLMGPAGGWGLAEIYVNGRSFAMGTTSPGRAHSRRLSANGSLPYPRRRPAASPRTVSSRRGREALGGPCTRMNRASRCASSSSRETAASALPVSFQTLKRMWRSGSLLPK